MGLKRTLTIILPVVLVLAIVYACARDRTRNDEAASVTRAGDMYRIELTGIRHLSAHDPVSLLMRQTYAESYVLTVPRIEGVVDGGEIPVKPGHYRLLGGIAFADGRMTVDLYYDNTDDGVRDPLSWNGSYVLRFAAGP